MQLRRGDIAALTLLSLALTATKARIDFQKPRLPSLHLSSSQRRSSNPVLIPFDKVETLVTVPSEETVMSKPSKVVQHCTLPKTLTEPESKILLSDDWRKVFKPLPMPPKLPKLPAGAKARSFVVKKADLTQ